LQPPRAPTGNGPTTAAGPMSAFSRRGLAHHRSARPGDQPLYEAGRCPPLVRPNGREFYNYVELPRPRWEGRRLRDPPRIAKPARSFSIGRQRGFGLSTAHLRGMYAIRPFTISARRTAWWLARGIPSAIKPLLFTPRPASPASPFCLRARGALGRRWAGRGPARPAQVAQPSCMASCSFNHRAAEGTIFAGIQRVCLPGETHRRRAWARIVERLQTGGRAGPAGRGRSPISEGRGAGCVSTAHLRPDSVAGCNQRSGRALWHLFLSGGCRFPSARARP